MFSKLDRLAVAALCSLGFTGCLSEEVTDDAALETSSVEADIQAAAQAANFHVIKNKLYNQCVDAPGSINTTLRIAGCSNTLRQSWAFVAAGPPSTFFIVNGSTGLCMEVNNGTATPGERVDQFSCNGSTAEQWVASTRLVGGVAYQQYRHVGTNQCLDTVGAQNSNLMQFTCDPNGDAQSWLVQ